MFTELLVKAKEFDEVRPSNPKSETLNSKPSTLDPKPETRKPKP